MQTADDLIEQAVVDPTRWPAGLGAGGQVDQ